MNSNKAAAEAPTESFDSITSLRLLMETIESSAPPALDTTITREEPRTGDWATIARWLTKALDRCGGVDLAVLRTFS